MKYEYTEGLSNSALKTLPEALDDTGVLFSMTKQETASHLIEKSTFLPIN